MHNCSWIIYRAHSLDISSVSVILFAKICRSDKIRLWIWSTLLELTLLKGSQTVLHLGSQNLHSGYCHTILLQLSMTSTCHPVFASCTHRYSLEFSSVRPGMSRWPSIQHLKIPHFLLIWFSQWSEAKAKVRTMILKMGTLQYKRSPSSYNDKITMKIWETGSTKNFTNTSYFIKLIIYFPNN